MRFVSTTGADGPVPLRTALLRGAPPGGGLYVPEALPPLPPSLRDEILRLPWPELAVRLARHLLGGALPAGVVEGVTREALDFPVPLVRIRDDLFVLELFHGPTLAFKDVGSRFLARLLMAVRGPDEAPLTVLVATSGDTGGAVARAFHGIPDIRVVVLFPEGRVGPVQERQFTTLGGNVTALAVQGDFDDCQRLTREAFDDPLLRSRLSLTSANSVNVGRLLPQIFYYFQAWARLEETGALRSPGVDPGLRVSVPSGNLGNLAAGLMARRLGLPARGFVAALNANDALRRFLETGRLDPRPALPTLSTAMDVGNPSNLARLRHLHGDRLDLLREEVRPRSFHDGTVAACIRRVHEEHGYLLDPHSAVGFLALEAELRERPSTVGVTLATAHPAKFHESVAAVLGRPVPLPPPLLELLERPRWAETIPPTLDALREVLLEGL